jgi:hypothetical protein
MRDISISTFYAELFLSLHVNVPAKRWIAIVYVGLLYSSMSVTLVFSKIT